MQWLMIDIGFSCR